MNALFVAGASAVRHSIMRTISVLCVLAVCAGIWFAIDRAFINPKETASYEQKAEQITKTISDRSRYSVYLLRCLISLLSLGGFSYF